MLITKTDILTYRDISKSVRDDKINPFIKDAERLDLRPLLGEQLYYDIVDNPSVTRNTDLLNAKSYTYLSKTYKHGGLKEILALYSWSRYVMFGSYTDTAFGFVQKSTQDSERVAYQDRKNVYTKECQTALALWGDVERFLIRNASSYTHWTNGGCGTSKRKGFRISKIN